MLAAAWNTIKISLHVTVPNVHCSCSSWCRPINTGPLWFTSHGVFRATWFHESIPLFVDNDRTPLPWVTAYILPNRAARMRHLVSFAGPSSVGGMMHAPRVRTPTVNFHAQSLRHWLRPRSIDDQVCIECSGTAAGKILDWDRSNTSLIGKSTFCHATTPRHFRVILCASRSLLVF